MLFLLASSVSTSIVYLERGFSEMFKYPKFLSDKTLFGVEVILLPWIADKNEFKN